MKYHSIRKSFSICAAALMLISAGGNTLRAGAKSYHHKRISRRITRRHISRYQYRKNYQLYKRLQKHIQSNNGRLKKLRKSFKRYHHGRLYRNLKKHQQNIQRSIRYEKNLSDRLNRKYNFKKPNIKQNKRKAVSKKKPLTAAQKSAKEKAYQKENEEYIKENNENVLGSNGVESESTALSSNSANSSSSVASESTKVFSNNASSSSSNIENSTSSYDINSEASNLASDWYNNSYGHEYYTKSPETLDELTSFVKEQLIEHPDANANNGYEYNHGFDNLNQPTIYTLEDFEKSNRSPKTTSADAWNYINQVSNIYNSENNYVASNAQNDGVAGQGVDDETLYNTLSCYTDALGHHSFENDTASYINSSAAANQLNAWYQQHSISPSTASADAIALNEANNPATNSPLHVPANFGAHDDAAAPAQGTDAAFNQALNTDSSDVENGNSNGFNGIENYM